MGLMLQRAWFALLRSEVAGDLLTDAQMAQEGPGSGPASSAVLVLKLDATDQVRLPEGSRGRLRILGYRGPGQVGLQELPGC